MKKNSTTLFCLSILLIFLFLSCDKSRNTPENIVKAYYRHGQFNGSILIAKNDSIICDTLFGYSDFNTKKSFSKPAPFYIASLSKPITAIAIALLQQKKLLSYDDNASKYVNGLPEYMQHITLRQLLTHTSGIKDYEAFFRSKKEPTNQDVLQWLNRQGALKFTPYSQFEYSNSGYIVLSIVIERISGQSYSEFVQQNVFAPLLMQNTRVYDQTKPIIANKAIGFDKDKMLDDYSFLTTGDGGIYSTVEDLYKLDKALRNNLLLNKANTGLLYQPPMLSNGKKSIYGFGWFIENYQGATIAVHTGGLNGFRSLFWRDLKNNITIIALTNQGDAFPLNDFLDDLKKTL